MNCVMNVSGVMDALKYQASLVTTEIRQGPKHVCFIKARKVSGLADGVPVVELLAPESTPDHHVPDQAAEQAWNKSVAELVASGRSFYTELRSDWGHPVLLWDK